MDDKPEGTMKVDVKAGGRVSICTCGQSKKLPFCDNSHREFNEKHGTAYKSVKIWPDKDVELEVLSKNWP